MTARPEGGSSADREAYGRTAFGIALSIDSRIEIPGLGQGPSSASASAPTHVRLDAGELERRWGSCTTTPERTRELRAGETLVLSVDAAEPAGYLMWAKELGRALVSPDGLEVLCDPDPAKDWVRILVAQTLPLAATLRGIEVFHASAVVLDGRAVLFSGPVGAGKSSLAAAAVRAGAQLLSDDVVALEPGEEALIAYAGSVVTQLRDGEDRLLSEPERAALGSPLLATAGKHRYASAHVPDPTPLAALCLLERSDQEPAVEQLPAVSPFELIASTFNLSVRTPVRLQRQLDVVSAIASLGLAYRLRVQPGVSAAALADIVQAQLSVPAS